MKKGANTDVNKEASAEIELQQLLPLFHRIERGGGGGGGPLRRVNSSAGLTIFQKAGC